MSIKNARYAYLLIRGCCTAANPKQSNPPPKRGTNDAGFLFSTKLLIRIAQFIIIKNKPKIIKVAIIKKLLYSTGIRTPLSPTYKCELHLVLCI